MNVQTAEFDPPTDLIKFLGRKWTLEIMKQLGRRSHRFNQLSEATGNISSKTLSKRLKEMRERGFVEKKTYAMSPPRTEYKLTEEGQNLLKCVGYMDECACN